jgi:predicted acyl esterase
VLQAAAAGSALSALGVPALAELPKGVTLLPTQKIQPESDAALAKIPRGRGVGPKLYRSIMRRGDPPDKPKTRLPAPPPVHQVIREDGLLIEKNVAITLRDGVKIYADLYRPDGPAGEKNLPCIIGWSPYGKHGTGTSFPGAGVKPEWINKHTAFEAPNPEYWCPHGYAVMFVDPRGLWWSEGEGHHNGIIENLDCYDTIEWAGVQPWCNGKVGLSGVSYLAAISWSVAPLKPPHLAAINPWEGFSDWYREFAFHGGIRETGFAPYAVSTLNNPLTYTEDTTANIVAHPLDDEYYASKKNYMEEIECPMFVVASWSDQLATTNIGHSMSSR